MKSKIDTSGWKEFKLGELFEFSAIKQAKSQQLIPTVSKEDDNSIPYVVQSKYNNMVSRYVDKQWLIDHDEPPVKGNTLVLGVTLNACSYQATSFGASQVITARLNKINKNIGIFIATIISKYIEVFTYKEKPGIKKYEQTIIKLPATDEDLPDFDYMDAYMSRIFEEEEAFVDKLEEEDFSGHKIDTSGWKEFKIGDLFDVIKGTRLTKADMKQGNYRFIGSSAINNGVTAYIENDEHIHAGNKLTVCYNGSIGETFYQDLPFWASDDVNVLYPKTTMSKNVCMFIAPIIKCISKKYSYVNKWRQYVMQEEYVRLPVTDEGLPDFEYMDTYMQRIMEEEEAVADKITEE